MSGSALSPWAIARDTDIYAKQLAQSLNCPFHVSPVLLSFDLFGNLFNKNLNPNGISV